MQIERKTAIAITVSVICFFIGSIITGIGISQTWKGMDEQKTANLPLPTPEYVITHPIIAQMIPSDPYPASLVRSIVVAIHGEAPYFVHEPINYSAIAFVNDKVNANTIYIVAVSQVEDNNFNVINDSQIPFVIGKEEMANHVIELSADTDPPYYKEGNLNFSTSADILYHIFIVSKNNHFIETDSYSSGLTIEPESSEIQYQTNKAILQQIEQSKQEVKSTTATNDIVIGLTYVIIGLVPLALGAEIIIHKWLVN